MKRLLSLITATLLATSIINAAKPEIVAHRGYWTTYGSAQNSIRSLVKADSIECYGVELDVWMTADSVLILNHDPSINGVVIEKSPASIVLSNRLSNGESLPTLDAWLDTAAILKPSTRLILEMKPHADRAHELQCVKEILAMVDKKGLADRMEYITFSREGMLDLIRLAPEGTPVYYLNGELNPFQLKAMGSAGPDYHISHIKRHPQWIEQAHRLGLKVNIWTIDKEEDMIWCIENGADYITTNEPVLLQTILKRP